LDPSAVQGDGEAVSYEIYKKLGAEIGDLVTAKQIQYGDSAGRAGQILAVLYPSGVPRHAYDDALLIVRCLDKFSRIAQRGDDGKDLGGESPWKDIAGYGLLGWQKDDTAESEDLPVEVARMSGGMTGRGFGPP
jgi:hypothetical protein